MATLCGALWRGPNPNDPSIRLCNPLISFGCTAVSSWDTLSAAPAAHPIRTASTDKIVGRWRAISSQLSPASSLAKTDPVLVPK